jgi:hypothetical protein
VSLNLNDRRRKIVLKHVLMTGAMLVAVPALAQTAPSGGQTTPAAPTTTAPTTATPPAPITPQPTAPAAPQTGPATAATPATPADPGASPATPAAPAAPAAPATADAAPAAPAAAAPAPGAQIADVVGKEFPSYDRNKDGKLSKAEFGAWMFALRKASNPALKDDAANKTYVAGAFATADTDKSKSVSKDELTNYLTQGQAAASTGS